MLTLKNELIDIAQRAGDAIIEIYNTGDFSVEAKADDSPLTIADKTANDIICEGLKKLSKQYPIISEENKLVDYEERSKYDHYWLVDPLDGTKEFIKKNGEFTVNIALIKGQQAVMGIVYAPVLKEMYWAVKGEGAYLISNGKEQKLIANEFTTSDEGLRVVCSRSHLNEETQAFVNELKAPVLVAKGSSLKFLILAKGDAELYPRIAPTMEWDTAAAQIVLEEAGGSVKIFGTDDPVIYNKRDLLNPFFVASASRSV